MTLEAAVEEVHRVLEALGKGERRVVMATVVATRGATPKKEGARMWVGEVGRALGSVTIGGPVDAKVIAESRGVLATGEPRLLRVTLPDEDAWDMGLACGGILDVLLEALELGPRPAPMVLAYRRIASELERGRAACLIRPLRDPARSLLVKQDGTAEGSLGGAERDEAAIRLATQLFPAGLPVTQQIAGEGTEAFFEVHAPRPHLIAVGAGHMSMPLVSLARALGFRTTVVDPRPRFATRERFPEADDLRVGIPSEIVAGLPLVPSTAVVLTIHDSEVEVPVLRAVLEADAGYVGMLGSRKRGRGVLEMLRREGVPPERLARVQVPVGLDIGAQTAAEIALSVVAQIVAMRNRRTGTGLAEQRP
jgi:xanthine dehydrogenase accessory factor